MGLRRRRKKYKASVKVWARRVPFDFHVIVLSTRAVELLCHLGSQFAPVWVRGREVVFPFVGNWCSPLRREFSAYQWHVYGLTQNTGINSLSARSPHPTLPDRPIGLKGGLVFCFFLGFFFFFSCSCMGPLLSRRNRWFVKQMVVDLNRCRLQLLTRELSSPLNARKSLCFFLFFWRRQNRVLMDGYTHHRFHRYRFILFYLFLIN